VLLTVSGTVAHHTPDAQAARGNGPRARGRFDPEAPLAAHPRAFAQSFVLVDAANLRTAGTPPAPGAGVACTAPSGKDGTITLAATYFIQADSFRFVG
jgi:hypothetical protein